jgi:hypothetical protein
MLTGCLVLHGSESEYKRHFRDWGVRKRTLGSEKRAMIRALGKHPDPPQSISAMFPDKPVDKTNLRRHIIEEARSQTVETMSPGVYVCSCRILFVSTKLRRAYVIGINLDCHPGICHFLRWPQT